MIFETLLMGIMCMQGGAGWTPQKLMSRLQARPQQGTYNPTYRPTKLYPLYQIIYSIKHDKKKTVCVVGQWPWQWPWPQYGTNTCSFSWELYQLYNGKQFKFSPQKPTKDHWSWLNHEESLQSFDIILFKMIFSRTTGEHGVQSSPHWLI